VIAATNRDLRGEVNVARFRHDLYHRLAVVVLRLPPLRDRREGVALLVEHFARELGAEGPLEQLFGAETLARWQRHPWPGNVRELRNSVEAALVVGTGDSVTMPAQPATAGAGDELPAYKDARALVVGEFERDYLTRLLARSGGNVSAAARIARMDRSHLIDLLQRHGLKD
jgi:DNA-binding NtrC family response regulator